MTGAALGVTVVATVLFVLARNYLAGAMEGDIMRGLEAARRQNPNLTEEQLAAMRGFGEKIGLIAAPFIIAIGLFFSGIALWLVGKLFGATASLGLAMMVATYSQFPRLLQGVLNAVQGYLMDPAAMTSMYSVSASPARFFDPATTSPAMMAALSRLDLFTIWCTILLGIGLAIVGNISKARAFAAAAIVWVLGGLFIVLPAMRQG